MLLQDTRNDVLNIRNAFYGIINVLPNSKYTFLPIVASFNNRSIFKKIHCTNENLEELMK